jgi:hypothetical protein
MTRLPVPGRDDGHWGDVLNAFLLIEHNDDGTLKMRTDGSLDVSKADFGLDLVDNTRDIDKPISTAVQAALAGKRDAGEILPLTAGGTGATTAAGARARLGVCMWRPQDSGMLAWSFDPVAAINGQVIPVAGQLQCVRIPVIAGTVATIIMDVFTAGTNLQHCYAAVYQNGVLLGKTADQSSAWQSTNGKVMALTSPVTVQDGCVYVTFWANTSGGTLPAFTRGQSRSSLNIALTADSYRSATTGSGITTAPPSALGTLNAGSSSWWVGLA